MGGSSWLMRICCVARNLFDSRRTTAVHDFMFLQQYVIKICVVC